MPLFAGLRNAAPRGGVFPLGLLGDGVTSSSSSCLPLPPFLLSMELSVEAYQSLVSLGSCHSGIPRRSGFKLGDVVAQRQEFS